MIKLETPISEKAIRELKVGDEVYLSGRVVTARDVAHKYMVEEKPEFLKEILNESVIYHCGPVVKQEEGTWKIVAEHSGHKKTVIMESTEAQSGGGLEMPLYTRIIAGFGYLVGIAGIAMLIISRKAKRGSSSNRIS